MSPAAASVGRGFVGATVGVGVGAIVDVVDVVDDVVLVDVLVVVLVDGAMLLEVVDGLDVDVVLVVRLVLGTLVESSDEQAAIVSATNSARPGAGRCLTRE